MLLLVPIIVGALLALALGLWLLVRWWRMRNTRSGGPKRSDSALLPVIDPAALLSPTPRECDSPKNPRGAALSFLSSTSSTAPAATTASATDASQSQPPQRTSASTGVSNSSTRGSSSVGGGSDGITSTQATVLYRLLHSDPNVSAHRLAFHKIAFERRLSSSSTARDAPSSASSSHCVAAYETWLCQYEGDEIVVKVLARHSHRHSHNYHRHYSTHAHAAHYDRLAQLVDEIQLTASLEHANVVRFLGLAWDSTAIESLCLITEYVPGGDLATVLHTRQQIESSSWSRAMLDIVTGVAYALQYLHARGVAHGDVRAKNIVLSDRESEPKLINIRGTSARDSDKDDDEASFWLAPELLRPRGKRSSQSDMFAFGALLMEIDTNGQLVYETEDVDIVATVDDGGKISDKVAGNDQQETVAATLPTSTQQQRQRRHVQRASAAFAFSTECPPYVIDIARQCLQADPRQRMDATAVCELLERSSSLSSSMLTA